MQPAINIQLHKQDPHTGQWFWHTRTKGEVLEEVKARLKTMTHPNVEGTLADATDGFSVFWGDTPSTYDQYDKPWPDTWSWIACFAVTGGSEAHWIHVEVIRPNGKEKRELVYLAKCFHGMKAALAVSNALTDMLGA